VRVERSSVETFLATRRSLRQRRHRRSAADGLSRDAVAGIIAMTPARLVYVSCDVATLARDARALIDGGYTLGSMTALDLFPNTAHVETVDGLHSLSVIQFLRNRALVGS
jgi:hypothetical protein